jgi:hypothetical protein
MRFELSVPTEIATTSQDLATGRYGLGAEACAEASARLDDVGARIAWSSIVARLSPHLASRIEVSADSPPLFQSSRDGFKPMSWCDEAQSSTPNTSTIAGLRGFLSDQLVILPVSALPQLGIDTPTFAVAACFSQPEVDYGQARKRWKRLRQSKSYYLALLPGFVFCASAGAPNKIETVPPEYSNEIS